MALMRHESIETTMRYYVGGNSTAVADAIWDAGKSQKGTFLVTLGENEMDLPDCGESQPQELKEVI